MSFLLCSHTHPAVMLDDLNRGIDNTSTRLNRETKHIIHISEKAKTNGERPRKLFVCALMLRPPAAVGR
jgi:hypothetical protein